MDFQKVHLWPRPVRIRLQGSKPGKVCQSFLGIKNAASYKTMRQIGGPRGIRTLDLSDANRTLSQQSRFCAHLMHCEKRKINVYSSIWNDLPSQRPFLVASMVSNPLIFKMKQFEA